MKIELTKDVEGLGKAGTIHEVESPRGNHLVCQGCCTVLEYDAPAKSAGAKVVSDRQAKRLEEGKG